MGTDLGPPDEPRPLLDQGLPRAVRWMGLAGHDELDGALGIGQQAQEPSRVVQQQVRSLVGRETPREAECQRVGIEHRVRRVHRVG